MPKSLYAVRFFRTVASVLARRILRANAGRWPSNLNQWQVVCARFRYVLLIVPDEPRLRACYIPQARALVIPWTPNRRRLYRSIAHEVAEGLLRDGQADGRHLLDWPNDEWECHITAKIVEERVDVALRQAGQLELDLPGLAEGLS